MGKRTFLTGAKADSKSDFGTDFNWDYHVSFRPDDVERKRFYYNFRVQSFPVAEGPGISVFYKDQSGTVFHTYSSCSRVSICSSARTTCWTLFQKGRDEAGFHYGMGWLRHHDRYNDASFADPYVKLLSEKQMQGRSFVVAPGCR